MWLERPGSTIGSAALLPVLRSPVTLAHTLATLDQLADGRLVLALGSGFGLPANRAEFEAVGAAFDQRVGRLLETAHPSKPVARRCGWPPARPPEPAGLVVRRDDDDVFGRRQIPAVIAGARRWRR
ncbi:LLM class flavin-dependent oxidoreductase [Nonomuraea jabiensis]|uniref:LLM class flavin-dependent oxidoreductase n=1 Tax=Nonomuraea jabiensis TaxID=882448 RepID=UPI0016073CD1